MDFCANRRHKVAQALPGWIACGRRREREGRKSRKSVSYFRGNNSYLDHVLKIYCCISFFRCSFLCARASRIRRDDTRKTLPDCIVGRETRSEETKNSKQEKASSGVRIGQDGLGRREGGNVDVGARKKLKDFPRATIRTDWNANSSPSSRYAELGRAASAKRAHQRCRTISGTSV